MDKSWRIFLLLMWCSGCRGQSSESSEEAPPSDQFFHRDGDDGSYKFGYKNYDKGGHYHSAEGSADNTVVGRYGFRDPATRRVGQTTYTAGRRGFRARGPDIARRMDLSQKPIPYSPPIPSDSPLYNPTYDGYHDPNEDASYEFSFKTGIHSRAEISGPKGDVTGSYSYLDDVGERHDVRYEAGAGVGFVVKTPYPDSEAFGGLFYRGLGKPGNRGRSSIQRNKDGSYKFTASGPDQRRTEAADASGRVKGSYVYIDDKGTERTVHYIAGPGIGYRIVGKGAIPPPIPADHLFYPEFEGGLKEKVGGTWGIDDDVAYSKANSKFGEDKNLSLDVPLDTRKPLFKPSSSSSSSSFRGETGKDPSFQGHRDENQTNPFSDPSQERLTPSRGHSNPFKGHSTSYYPGHPPYHDGSDKSSYLPPATTTTTSNPFASSEEESGYHYPKPTSGIWSRERDDEYDSRVEGSDRKYLKLPRGLRVRAHVQNIDILPFGYRIPSPDHVMRRQYGQY